MSMPEDIDIIPYALAALEVYMWTLTFDETKVIISTLQEYFASPDLNEVLKGPLCSEDVLDLLELEEEMKT